MRDKNISHAIVLTSNLFVSLMTTLECQHCAGSTIRLVINVDFDFVLVVVNSNHNSIYLD